MYSDDALACVRVVEVAAPEVTKPNDVQVQVFAVATSIGDSFVGSRPVPHRLSVCPPPPPGFWAAARTSPDGNAASAQMRCCGPQGVPATKPSHFGLTPWLRGVGFVSAPRNP
jgi:hypothetical protein